MEGYACTIFPLFPIPKMYFMALFWYCKGRTLRGFSKNTWVLSWNVRPTWAVFKASWSSVSPSVALVFGLFLTLKDKRLLLSVTLKFGQQNAQGQLLWAVQSREEGTTRLWWRLNFYGNQPIFRHRSTFGVCYLVPRRPRLSLSP